jgi:hypothetical protein
MGGFRAVEARVALLMSFCSACIVYNETLVFNGHDDGSIADGRGGADGDADGGSATGNDAGQAGEEAGLPGPEADAGSRCQPVAES